LLGSIYYPKVRISDRELYFKELLKEEKYVRQKYLASLEHCLFFEMRQNLSLDIYKYLESIIKTNESSYGVPQGASLSNILMNISLIEFDTEISELCADRGVKYIRYVDDMIFIGNDDDIKFIRNNISLIFSKSGDKLKINQSKTKYTKFRRDNKTLKIKSYGDNFEYLGIMFDGFNISVSYDTINSYLSEISEGIKIKNQGLLYLLQVKKAFSDMSLNPLFKNIPNIKNFTEQQYGYQLERVRNKFIKHLSNQDKQLS